MALRYADVPVVVAPAGLTLGGGCEIALHADRVQAAAETYMGLVEVGVGLIPAGGGTKEMLARAMEAAAGTGARSAAATCSACSRRSASPRCRPAAPTRGGSATSATVDGITMNRERLIADAKAVGARARREGLPAAAAADGDSGRRRGRLARAQARRPPGVARRPHQRSRRAHRPNAGAHPRRRRRAAPGDRQRAVPARSRARGVPEPVRRAEDAGADPAHAEDRKAAEELSEPCSIEATTDRRHRRSCLASQGRLGVDDARARRARRTLPDDLVLAVRRHRIRPTRCDPALGFDNYLAQLDAVLDRAGRRRERRSAACRSAASSRCDTPRRDPSGSSRSCSSSAPAPGWQPNRSGSSATRAAVAARPAVRARPRRCGVWPEVRAALPTLASRLGFFVAPGAARRRRADVPSLDGRRGSRLARQTDFAPTAAACRAPTLVVTGEDRARPRRAGRRARGRTAELIPRRQSRVLERTGHIGAR